MGAKMTGRVAAIGSIAFVLGGCADPSDPLTRCLESTETTILLRELNLTETARASLSSCRDMQLGEAFCRGLYLDASGAVQKCMNEAGYIFLDPSFYLSHNESPYKAGNPVQGGQIKDEVCSWPRYQESACYRQALWFKATHWWALRPQS
jgi:hypothetical protein